MRFRSSFSLFLVLACLVLGLSVGGWPSGSALAQPAAPAATPAPARDAGDAAKRALDQMETTLERRLSERELTALRNQLDPIRDALATAITQVEPRLAEARDRLNQLGPKPADNAPLESPEAKQQRDAQAKVVADLDALVKALKVQQVRVDQLVDRITEQRRQIFTAQLFERTVPIVDPRFWTQFADDLGRFWISLQHLASDWWAYLTDIVGSGRVAGAAVMGLAALIGFVVLYRMMRRHGLYAAPEGEPATKLAKVRAAFRTAGERALVVPLIVGVAALIADNFQLVLPRARPLVPTAVLVAVVIVALTRGIMQATLAPGAPAYRLVAFSDSYAEALFAAMRRAAWVMAFSVVLLALAGVAVAPVTVTAFITFASAIVLAGIIVLFLRATTDTPEESDQPAAAPPPPRVAGWTRPALWLALAVIIGALLAGYIAFGAFLATRIAAAVVIACATVMILALLDALIAEWFGATTVRGRSLAIAIGIRPDRLDLIGTLIGGVLHVFVLFGSLLAVFGSWDFGGAGARLEDAFFGARFGDMRSLGLALLSAGVTIAIGFFGVRAVLNWVRDQVMPRTKLDSGLQNSIATILGYAGFAVVAGLALRQLGLDLSNITIIAGALSVGIGFGLQSIVQNFVSGLILLAERPIRVGDSIVVKGEEGYVRKISVRSTEIETFERATVILPNAELISGVVKNWTHSNTLSRLTVPVRVGFESDPEVVQDELIAAACDNRFVLQQPPPRVYLMRFADLGIDFELRCVVSNVEYSLTVKSDLQLSILKRFRDKGIIMMPTTSYRDSEIKREVPPPSPAPEKG